VNERKPIFHFDDQGEMIGMLPEFEAMLKERLKNIDPSKSISVAEARRTIAEERAARRARAGETTA
jgi:hypothetical protein